MMNMNLKLKWMLQMTFKIGVVHVMLNLVQIVMVSKMTHATMIIVHVIQWTIMILMSYLILLIM